MYIDKCDGHLIGSCDRRKIQFRFQTHIKWYTPTFFLQSTQDFKVFGVSSVLRRFGHAQFHLQATAQRLGCSKKVACSCTRVQGLSQRRWVNIKLQDCVLRTQSMFLIIFRISIPHRSCTYLELCPTKESWLIEQTTTSKKNFVIPKFCAKDTNKFQQASQEVRRFDEKMFINRFLELNCAKNNVLFEVVSNQKNPQDQPQYHLQQESCDLRLLCKRLEHIFTNFS